MVPSDLLRVVGRLVRLTCLLEGDAAEILDLVHGETERACDLVEGHVTLSSGVGLCSAEAQEQDGIGHLLPLRFRFLIEGLRHYYNFFQGLFGVLLQDYYNFRGFLVLRESENS